MKKPFNIKREMFICGRVLPEGILHSRQSCPITKKKQEKREQCKSITTLELVTRPSPNSIRQRQLIPRIAARIISIRKPSLKTTQRSLYPSASASSINVRIHFSDLATFLIGAIKISALSSLKLPQRYGITSTRTSRGCRLSMAAIFT